MRLHYLSILLPLAALYSAGALTDPRGGGLAIRGTIVDDSSGRPVAARLYIESGEGHWFFARSAAKEGTAVGYRKQRTPSCLEVHTSLSAHPFVADVPPGSYTITVERGKEYFTHRQQVQLSERPIDLAIRLKRWVNMAQSGWYSGETHIHRNMHELPTAMLAEDLNVAFPLTYWVTKSGTAPSSGDKTVPPVKPALLQLDALHVLYPVNTEYEIVTVNEKRHTLGAVFALNHRSVLEEGVPPVSRIAQQVHREGGLLDLDKHNWPWSMMLVPVMNIDLYELANNHMWRTTFDFGAWGEAAAPYMEIERDARGLTERGWIEFTFQNYYALLNCGFRLRPTAGTASGVHPVPLGFGRVYVHLDEAFSYSAWLKRLNEGRSFVTTGPMLIVKLNDTLAGHPFRQPAGERRPYTLSVLARSARPLSKIEVVSAGRVSEVITPKNRRDKTGAYVTSIRTKVESTDSTWVAVRCFESMEEGRIRFAHSAPFHIEVPGRPLRPLRREVEYLIRKMEAEIERNKSVLPKAAIDEYEKALMAYREIAKSAR